MKKVITLCLFVLMAMTASAQKFALVDMDYILKNIPTYVRANEQLDQLGDRWKAEVDSLNSVASTMYKNYQNEMTYLSQKQKQTRQQAIVNKEKQANDLKKSYFGPDGELAKRREALMTPIQQKIYNAVKTICELHDYSLVVDRSSNSSIIFGSPQIDISDEVLKKLGYSNN
ncbi:MAG: OmpH family outer membrane protein [Prevotella sp.]|jgi:outer membrane protein|nr:OmpH family outer membrane protein [Prevotella sp.]MCH3994980.1 OmpH family outer membrane protein [Prevotella sp.]